MPCSCLCIVECILALFLPPLAVALDRGCGCDMLLNFALTLLGWIPGVIHAYFVVLHCGAYWD